MFFAVRIQSSAPLIAGRSQLRHHYDTLIAQHAAQFVQIEERIRTILGTEIAITPLDDLGALGGVAQRANEYGSMPSLHVAWAVWVALTVASMTTSRAWRATAWTHVALTSVVVIATGNHYLLDVLAGALTCAVGWAVAVVRRTEVPVPVDEPVLQTTS